MPLSVENGKAIELEDSDEDDSPALSERPAELTAVDSDIDEAEISKNDEPDDA